MTKIKESMVDKMILKIYSDRESMGCEAAKEAINYIKNIE